EQQLFSHFYLNSYKLLSEANSLKNFLPCAKAHQSYTVCNADRKTKRKHRHSFYPKTTRKISPAYNKPAGLLG
ncbi:MAG: hypothetical protein ACTTKL_10365, partial [Treponema sp.]